MQFAVLAEAKGELPSLCHQRLVHLKGDQTDSQTSEATCTITVLQVAWRREVFPLSVNLLYNDDIYLFIHLSKHAFAKLCGVFAWFF